MAKRRRWIKPARRPNHLIELGLSHSLGSAVERAYRRGDLFDQRRRLMQDWAEYCSRPSVEADVVPLRGKAQIS
jgi:hypothetical protein